MKIKLLYIRFLLFGYLSLLFAAERRIPEIATCFPSISGSSFYHSHISNNKLSGYGIVANGSTSFGGFSLGNPALLNNYNRFELGFSSLEGSSYLDLYKDPFASLSIVLPFTYKIGISYNNIYSTYLSRLATTQEYPDGEYGRNFSLERTLDKYSILMANQLKLFNTDIYYGIQFNEYSYMEKIYTTEISASGRSFALGILIPSSNSKFGFYMESEASMSGELIGIGLSSPILEDSSPNGNLGKVSIPYDFSYPMNIGLGFQSFLSPDIEIYIEHNRFFQPRRSCAFRNELIDYTIGFRYSVNQDLLASIGYYSQDDQENSNSLPSFHKNNRINLGFVYKSKFLIYDFGYAFTRTENYVVKLSISMYLDSFLNI